MGEQKNTIILNGKAYDTKNGSAGYGLKSKHQSSRPKTLDGFIRHHSATTHLKKTADKPHQAASVKHKSPTAHEVHGRREHSKTLLRSAVKNPRKLKPSALAGWLEPEAPVTDQTSAAVDKADSRLGRAKSVPKSKLIKRFSPAGLEPAVVKSTVSLPVKHHPSGHISQHVEHPIAETTKAIGSKQLFASALTKANSHEQKAPKRPKSNHRVAKKIGISKKVANIGAISLTVVVLAGFIAYQNMANIALRVAAGRAGIAAALPNYRPSGFALSRNVQASPGQVVINLHSNSDERDLKITQSVSDWNSQTLLDNFVATTDQPYQRISQDNGKTIFLFGNSGATWVDGGIWYKIEGNSNLASDQLVKMANSF